MKGSRELRRVAVVLLAISAAVVPVVAVACSGGGGDVPATLSTAPAGGVGATLAPVVTETTLVASGDALSSFQSKDPFILQAQLTTTTAAPTTTARPTTTTSIRTTATAPHRLQVTSLAPTFSFTLDGLTFSNQVVGSILSGGWGTLRVTQLTATAATFSRNEASFYELKLNDYVTW
jgi:hypothetical protein